MKIKEFFEQVTDRGAREEFIIDSLGANGDDFECGIACKHDGIYLRDYTVSMDD